MRLKWSTEVEIDDATGLPMIPEGLVWRVVEPSHIGSDYYMVQLCRRTEHKFLWVRKAILTVIGDHPVRREDISEQAILEAAAYALQHNNKILSYFHALAPIRTDLLGEYPPKSIGVGLSDAL